MADPLSVFGSVVSILGGIQSLTSKPPKPPKVPEPVVAPVPDDVTIAATARRTASRRAQSSGAVSTVLTDRLGA